MVEAGGGTQTRAVDRLGLVWLGMERCVGHFVTEGENKRVQRGREVMMAPLPPSSSLLLPLSRRFPPPPPLHPPLVSNFSPFSVLQCLVFLLLKDFFPLCFSHHTPLYLSSTSTYFFSFQNVCHLLNTSVHLLYLSPCSLLILPYISFSSPSVTSSSVLSPSHLMTCCLLCTAAH